MNTNKNTIKRNIKLLSWTAFIGFIIITTVSIYNTFIYLQNLKNIKLILQLIDEKTVTNTKIEVIQVLSNHIEGIATLLLILFLVGVIFSSIVFYLARKIKKETDQKIHSMDWVIE